MAVMLRSALRQLRDSVMHPLRRRRAFAALRRRPRPTSLLVVCHGNICRSPFAAALLHSACSPNGIRVDSRGFMGPGRASPSEAVRAAARYGVDLAAHRSQLLTADTARRAGLIVVMEPAQRRQICDRFARAGRDVVILGDLDPEPVQSRPIRDPINQSLWVFEDTYARIERCARELQRAIS